MGRNHGSFRHRNGVVKSLVGNVGDVHQHAQAIHLEDDLLAAVCQAIVVLDLGIVDIARGVGPLVGIRPAQSHVTNAEAVEIAQQVDIVFDRVTAFDTHQRSQFLLFVGTLDIVGAERHHHAVGMPRRLLINRIDQIERVAGEVALVGLRLHPDGKELSAKIACLGFIEADVAVVLGVGRSDVEILVEKTLRRVGVGVDNQRRLVNLASLGADLGRSILRIGGNEQ